MLDSFVVYLGEPAAVVADDLYVRFGVGSQFVLGSSPSVLPNEAMQNACRNEQIECVIYRSLRQAQFLAAFCQFVSRERLRHLAYLHEHHLAFGCMPHVMSGYIGIEVLQG